MRSQTLANAWRKLLKAFGASLFPAACGLLLSACSANSLVDALSPYRMDVRQGNYVSQEMVSRLTPGMPREQVRLIMGSPLLTDVFHADRWDYVYRYVPGSGEVELRRVALLFEKDKLVRVDGDVVAATEAKGEAAARPRVIDLSEPPAKP